MSARRGNDFTYVVVAVDRYTGTQTLLYDGKPTGSGETLECPPNAALDTTNNRLMLMEPLDGCRGRAFALVLETGTFARL